MGAVRVGSDNAGDGLSFGIWKDCPLDEIAANPNVGYGFFDDFVRFCPVAAASEASYGPYKGFASTGGLVTDGTAVGGVINASSDGDNEGASIATQMLPFKISGISGSKTKKLWFEAKIKSSSIANTKHGIFAGLLDSATLSATVPIAADGSLADQNFVGFHRLEGVGNYLNTVYKANGVTQVTVKDTAKIIVADTYMKVGIKFDPDANTLKFYFNGVEAADYLAAAVLGATAGTDFPNDVTLGVAFAVLNATGSSPGSASMDWWACYQLR